MKSWNPEQKLAIETRHKNILVSASAGSGKTGVLVQRLVDLVTIDGIEIDEILAMTFSEDAANEMKIRLSKEISTLLSTETDENKKTYLFRQLSKLSNAHISTIHSFCYSIVKEFYYLLQLTNQRISSLCDDAQQMIYKNQAMDVVLDGWMKENSESFITLTSMLCTRVEDLQPLRETIFKIADMAISQSDPEAWLKLCIENVQKDIFEKDSRISQVFMDYWKSRLTLYHQAMDSIKEQFIEHYPNEEKRWNTFLKKEELKPTYSSSFDEIREKVIACAKLPLPTSPDASNLTFKENRECIQAIEDEIISIPPSSVMNELSNQMIPLVSFLVEGVSTYLHEYERMKEEHEVIDFSDMEHFALRLLKNFPEVSSHYQSLFKQIMVDEFQDSNDVQDELVHLICQKNNVFRVGDVKQSIYGFRHALPSIMQSYKEVEDEYNQVIRFNRNYRSDASIVEFNNVLFQILMNIEGFDSLPFKDEDLSQIGLESQKKDNQPILFHALNPELKNYENEKIKKDIYKAEYIAHHILNQKEYDYKDICVLVRSNAKMDILKNVFEKYHIPYYMNHKTGFYESRSIQILISALNAFLNPEDDLYFMGLLTSSFFNLSSNDIALLAIKKKHSFYETIKQDNPHLLETFETIRQEKRITSLIEQCFLWNDFYETCTLQEQTNCDYFYQLACEYENTTSCELSSFIHHINGLKEQKTAQTSTIGKNDNVVRFMSIHNSKGLEFPVVYLWSSSNLHKMEMKDMILCDSELGLGFNLMQFPYRNIFKSYQRIAIEQKKNRDEIEEELRILYVATTRAKKQLHIVDFLDPKLDLTKPINYTKVNARKGTTSWILQSLCCMNRKDLFDINYVDKMWTSTPLQPKQEICSSLPKYIPTQSIDIVLPSEKENTHFDIQPLNFTKKEKVNYGTLIHTYLQYLPNRRWDEDDILDISKKYHLETSSKLFKDLENLNQNELYDSLRNTEIYHEYPFLVKTSDSILTGSMDFLSVGDSLTLIDFKSDYVSDENELIQHYEPQINLYKQALHLLYPNKEVKAYLYSFHLSKMIHI